MSRVDLVDVSKRYGSVKALDQITITFRDGEFFGLLGPSGSGKTTLLRAIAGFIDPDHGAISFDGERMESVPVHKRSIGMVFQNYALFPNLTVDGNIAFGLAVRGTSLAERHARVEEMLRLVQLPGLGSRKPRELSGGQQQRVALARALVTKPKVLLLDEPLGALDRRLRHEMQVELKEIQRKSGVTTIFVTHDQEQALTLSDRIAIINQGRLIQIGAPADVYEKPSTVFAARFLGDANVFTGQRSQGALVLDDGRHLLAPGASRTVIVRPEKMVALPQGEPYPAELSNRLSGTILQSIYSGASVTYRIAPGPGAGDAILVFMQNREGELLQPGSRVTVAWSPEHTVPVEA